MIRGWSCAGLRWSCRCRWAPVRPPSTIHRAHGPAYEAEIADSDASTTARARRRRPASRGAARRGHRRRPSRQRRAHGGGGPRCHRGAGGDLDHERRHRVEAADRDDATAIGIVYGVPGLVMMLVGGVDLHHLEDRGRARSRMQAFPRCRDRQTGARIPPPPPPPAPAPAPAGCADSAVRRREACRRRRRSCPRRRQSRRADAGDRSAGQRAWRPCRVRTPARRRSTCRWRSCPCRPWRRRRSAAGG